MALGLCVLAPSRYLFSLLDFPHSCYLFSSWLSVSFVNFPGPSEEARIIAVAVNCAPASEDAVLGEVGGAEASPHSGWQLGVGFRGRHCRRLAFQTPAKLLN